MFAATLARRSFLGTATAARTAGFSMRAASIGLFHSSGPPQQVPEKESKPPRQDPAIQQLVKNNREWVERKNKEDPEYFPALGRGQSPEFLYIGCSDSRVSISSLTGMDLGHLFVHRNIANMVVSADLVSSREIVACSHIMYTRTNSRFYIEEDLSCSLSPPWLAGFFFAEPLVRPYLRC